MLKRFLWVIGVVLVANAGAFAVVVRNSNGAPDASVQLTEREMRLSNVDTDSTGMTLSIEWDRDASNNWFDRAKLTSVGFDCSVDPNAPGAADHYSGLAVLPRTTYVVLQYDPDRAAEARPSGDTRVTRVPEYEPRLKPIDVGNDPHALRAKYPGGHRYIVTAGLVRLWFHRESANQPLKLDGRILGMLPGEVYVPQEMQATMLASLGKAGNREGPSVPLMHAPRYQVTVGYGSGLLPRIVEVKALAR
jgi:hypothetical protein